jgi:hypothetical protein
MKRNIPNLLSFFVLFVGALSSSACASPSIVVRHEDPRVQTAVVWVDGERVGTVERGEELNVDVARGLHKVEVKAQGEPDSAWTADGGALELVVDVRAVLTLMSSKARARTEE